MWLEAVLRRLNDDAERVVPGSEIDAWLGFPSRRLAVYGSLAPGEVNHGQLAAIRGKWRDGSVRGEKRAIGWGVDLGFPVLVWRPDGATVPVRLLTSNELPGHLTRLDAFEGDEYRRTLIPVTLAANVVVVANIYTASALMPPNEADG